MKVALATSNFPPEFWGGTERVVLALAKALQRAGDDVIVYAGSDLPHDGRDAIEEECDGVRVLRLRRRPDEGYGLVVRNLRLRHLVARLLAEHEREVLHIHHWSTLSGQLGRMARARGLRVVATLHDLWTTCGRFFRRPPAGITCPPAAERAACVPCAARSLAVPLPSLARGIRHRDREIARELRALHVVVAPSRFCAEAVRRHAPWPGPIEVVPHGLLEPVAARERAPAWDGQQPLRVGTFGNLVPDKGVALLVQAMAGVANAELHLSGAFLGAGFAEEVRAQAQAAGVNLVCHGPWRPGEPHPASHLHLAVFPSLCQETYGLVVEEALARGVPVVASSLGALGERIAGAGVVVDPTVETLGRELRRLAGAPALWRELAARTGRTWSTIEDAAVRYRALYRAAPA